MKKENKKRQIAKISVFITSIFVIFLSVTYAFINQTLVGEKRQVITAGNIELELLEDANNLTIEDALPMYDEVGMIQDAFTFRLVNRSASKANYVLKLVDITTSTDKLNTSIVKYGLVKDGVSSIKLLSTLNNGVIDKGVIDGEQTIEYSLRLWIDSEVEDEELISGKTLSYRIDIEAGQEIEKPVYAMMKRRNSSSSTEAFWQYADSITSIVFENSINIPSEVEEDKMWDVSADQNKSVLAYIEPDNEELTTYQLHIQGKDGVSANTDSSYLFSRFYQVTTIEGLEYFDTTNVTDMFGMFNGCSSLTSLDLSSFDTTNVVNMSSMFFKCSSLTSLDVSHFNTSNVTNMSFMFLECSSLTNLDVSNFNTAKVTNISSMFNGCESLISLDVSHFNTAKVTSISSMFNGCSSLMSLDVSHFDTTNVKNMSYMFNGCESLISLDVSHFNTAKVTNMVSMFGGCSSLINLDVSSFNTASVTNMSSMFSGCRGLTNLDVSSFNTASVTNMRSMFYGCRGLTNIDVSSFNTASVTNMSSMFYECRGLTNIDVSSFNTASVTDMSYMFSWCNILTNLDLSNFDTVNVTNMFLMFNECSSLTSLDLSSFDTTNVVNMGSMFFKCSSLTSLDLSGFNISNVTNNSSMFFSVKSDCLITVKDEVTKIWILGINSGLTNIVVKEA